MRKYRILFMLIALLFVLTAAAYSAENGTGNFTGGSFMLDRVYEDASAEAPHVLDPESSASLYSEKANVYIFAPDGTAEMLLREAGEIYREELSWDQEDGVITVRTDGNVEMELSFDPESSELHRYWKIDAPEAMYHDLDFTYVRIPLGDWQMDHVISSEPGQDPVRLDPETAGSLYAESSNIYSLQPFGAVKASYPEDYTEEGTWELTEEGLVITFESGEKMELVYDASEDMIHRYWKEEDPAASYHDLDFVYLHK